jgi:RNA polymerase sigma factor (TIGR02999 family)
MCPQPVPQSVTREPLDLQELVEQLVPVLYADLKRVARRERRRVYGSVTLQTTALVSEAYLKLRRGGSWASRAHFLNAAAMAMRQVLVDHARAHLAAKRGSGVHVMSLDGIDVAAPESDHTLLALDEALNELAALNSRLARVVECRFFAGYNEQETAEALDVNERTVRRDWVKAKAWLHRKLSS